MRLPLLSTCSFNLSWGSNHILHFSTQSAFSVYFVNKIFSCDSWLITLTNGVITGRKIITWHLNMIFQLRASFCRKLKSFPLWIKQSYVFCPLWAIRIIKKLFFLISDLYVHRYPSSWVLSINKKILHISTASTKTSCRDPRTCGTLLLKNSLEVLKLDCTLESPGEL